MPWGTGMYYLRTTHKDSLFLVKTIDSKLWMAFNV